MEFMDTGYNSSISYVGDSNLMFELEGKPIKIVRVGFGTLNSFGKLGVYFYTAGCSRECKGCHNKWLQDYYGVEEVYSYNKNSKEALTPLEIYKDTSAQWVSILGGEPLMNDKLEISRLIRDVKNLGWKVLLYTGYEFDEVPMYLKNHLDAIKTGNYDEDLKQEGGLLASSNQKLWVKGEDNTWKESNKL